MKNRYAYFITYCGVNVNPNNSQVFGSGTIFLPYEKINSVELRKKVSIEFYFIWNEINTICTLENFKLLSIERMELNDD